MGRPLTREDIDYLETHMDEMKKLTKTQLFFVIAPSVLFTSWILYRYYTIINYYN